MIFIKWIATGKNHAGLKRFMGNGISSRLLRSSRVLWPMIIMGYASARLTWSSPTR
ncbi:MAG: hypothetical protein WDO15_16410 [Bacteroidota bacterium]